MRCLRRDCVQRIARGTTSCAPLAFLKRVILRVILCTICFDYAFQSIYSLRRRYREFIPSVRPGTFERFISSLRRTCSPKTMGSLTLLYECEGRSRCS